MNPYFFIRHLENLQGGFFTQLVRIRDAHVRLDLMRVALDGAFSWVQLMLMLTYHDELVEALAMKILRERNSELMNQSDSNLDPLDPSGRLDQLDQDPPSDSLGPEFYASPRAASEASAASVSDQEPGGGSESGESDGSGGSGGKRGTETAESPPVKEELWGMCSVSFFVSA